MLLNTNKIYDKMEYETLYSIQNIMNMFDLKDSDKLKRNHARISRMMLTLKKHGMVKRNDEDEHGQFKEILYLKIKK